MPPLVIPVAFDFTCPNVLIGWKQAQGLRAEFGVEFDWLPYELWPEEIPWPEPRPSIPEPPDRPKIPSRIELQFMVEGLELPAAWRARPKQMRVHLPLEAVAYLKERAPDRVEAFMAAVFQAYWERGERIGDLDVVLELAGTDLREALESRAYRDQVVHFDAGAYKSGVWNVPTFWIGGERYAEQPYEVLANAVADALGRARPVRLPTGGARSSEDIYLDLEFPPAPEGRPYTFINMVATIDGKIVSGERDEHVVDLGSPVDHALMKRIEAAADCVLVGATTLRASKPTWNPKAERRAVITGSGELNYDHAFFSHGATVYGPKHIRAPDQVEHVAMEAPLDPKAVLEHMKKQGIERLLVMGGSNLNAQLITDNLVDELFLTLAPKVKLGKDVPTYADGEPLSRHQIQNYELLEEHRIGDELFLRYRRKH